jgi:hypothetical protein
MEMEQLRQPYSLTDHRHPSSAEVKGRVELYLYSGLWSRSRSRKEFLGGDGVGKNAPTPTPTPTSV